MLYNISDDEIYYSLWVPLCIYGIIHKYIIECVGFREDALE